jgi:hypothetical protein
MAFAMVLEVFARLWRKKKKRGYTGVFKRLRRNGHLEYQKAANSSAQIVTLEAQPQEKPLYVRHDNGFACKTVFLNIRSSKCRK